LADENLLFSCSVCRYCSLLAHPPTEQRPPDFSETN
jgi:hypothetical protein